MKNKKVLIGVILTVVIIVIAVIATVIFISNKEQEDVKTFFSDYFNLINDKNYEELYSKVASMNMSKEDFVARNENIYEGIDSSNIRISVNNVEKTDEGYNISYHEKMYTSVGLVEFDNKANVVKEEKELKIKWSSSLIFPQLGESDKVRVSTIKAKRGSILDRNDIPVAKDGKIASVGIVPGKLGADREANIQKISELTGVSVDYINELLSASYVKDDTFVPVKKIEDSNTELKEQLLTIPGIMINKEDGRVYSLGKEAAHLIGYVQPISSEELEQNEDKGYTTNSLIGKSGLELAYEDTLRGIDGTDIYIVDQNENRISTIATQDKKDGEDVKLTIDSSLQKQVYEQMENDKGFFVIMEPKTGELLALVSTPSYNSNDFVVGLTTDKWNNLNNDEAKPLYNRFIQKYCPGSTFKPVTGAIGLTSGTINPDEDLGYSGTSWQKDSSWGNYSITTLTGYSGPKNLLNGILHSDNIYFAQSVLKMGEETFTSGLNKIEFNTQLDFPLTLAKSQYASNNGSKIEGETKLADSGYGQGDILVNPIHMASIYSAFANDGNMIKPRIEYDESKNGEVLVENAFSKEAADIIENDLIQVVENPEGTANDMKIEGTTIAGKTGTAELKSSSDDTQSGTLGWFNCYTIDRANGSDMLIVSMVENVQDNSDGGSHYLIKKIRTLF